MISRINQMSRAYCLAQLDVLESQRMILMVELEALRGRAWWWRLLNWSRIMAVRDQVNRLSQQCASVRRLLNNPQFHDS